MFRKLIKHLSVLILATSFAGCSQDEFAPDFDGDGQVVITLNNAPATRANDSQNNEDRIGNLVIALYTEGVAENVAPVKLQKFATVDASKTAKVTLNISKNDVTTLFRDTEGATCRVFAVANVDLVSVADNATIEQLRSLAVTSGFATSKTPASFVMANGLADKVTYSSTGVIGSAKGTVTLKRAAAKISLNISLPESTKDEDGATWVPVTGTDGAIRVLLNNGVKNSIADPNWKASADADSWRPADGDFYSIRTSDTDVIRSMHASGSGDYPFTMDVPFYSYPNYWEDAPDETHKTTMTLLVPWQKQGESTWRVFYYEVPVNDQNMLVSNYAYTVNLKVNILGSLSPDTPAVVTDLTYQIVDWSTQDVNVNLNDYRYLVVSPDSYTVDNRASVDIPFYSSHEVEISNITIKYALLNYHYSGNGTVEMVTVSKNQIDKSNEMSGTIKFCEYQVVTETDGSLVLKVTHPIEAWTPRNSSGTKISTTNQPNNNNLNTLNQDSGPYYTRPTNPEMPYVPYTITVTLRHPDKPEFNKTVTIVQYPPIYIDALRNPGGDSYGYVFVNGGHNSLGGVHGLAGDNSNPNMYLINISVLGSGSEYIIGDPRIKGYDNALDNSGNISSGSWNADDATDSDVNYGSRWNPSYGWCQSASVLYPVNGESRTLRYYMPTNESSATANMIAPKIRVASSYGKTNELGKTNARRRMATYQEQGCPAGRWRLPTLAEIQYICYLSYEGEIPELFSDDGEYWCAQGIYSVADGKIVSGSSAYVRGVYDEWYWTQFPDYQLQTNAQGGYSYTLGDMPYQGNN